MLVIQTEERLSELFHSVLYSQVHIVISPSAPLDNIQVMVIVWRLRGNTVWTALCWIVWHNVHGQQHTYMSSSYRSNRLGLSHWDPYAMRRGGCLELYYCNMVEWLWWDSSLTSTTKWLNHPRNDLYCVEWDIKLPVNCTESYTYMSTSYCVLTVREALWSSCCPCSCTFGLVSFFVRLASLWFLLVFVYVSQYSCNCLKKTRFQNNIICWLVLELWVLKRLPV